MSEANLDAALADWLAPPSRAPDRMFAARVDTAISELALLHAAERRYARGFVRELAALGAVALAALVLANWSGLVVDRWVVTLPVGLLLLVLLSGKDRSTNGQTAARR